MSSPIGRRVGTFTIQSRLGAGGMGEVYRAHDSKLDRDVAIKMLPAEWLYDADRRARLDREARSLAALNHPSIGAIYGVEDLGDTRALILELVEGPTLDERLQDGALPIKEALAIAAQIADALDAAHQSGIVHRDLKPANVKVRTDGHVKVLDFGLAKIGADTASNATAAVTATLATRDGLVIGTAAYMSPEQARGNVVDKRTDIWAFGCVLYEMLTGRRAFAAPTHSDAIAAILGHVPDWEALPPSTPPAIRRLLERCLEKDAARRLRDIGDARVEIDDARHDSAPVKRASGTTARRSDRRAVSLVAIVGLTALMAAGTAWLLKPAPAIATVPVSRLTIPLPPGDQLQPLALATLAISPDGRTIVYAASRAGGSQQLFVRSIDQSDATPLAGTQNGYGPFFSPDGRWVGFFAQGKLKKVLAAGGGLETIADAALGLGGAWSRDDTIYFVPFTTSGIWKISANGGAAHEFTHLDRSQSEVSHRWPQVLSDGRTVLFSAWTGPGWDEHYLMAQSGENTAHRILVRGANTGRYVPSGYIVYSRAEALIAAPFDATSVSVTGPPTTLIDRATEQLSESAQFAVSETGTLIYVPTDPHVFERRLVWVTRDGKVEAIGAPPNAYTDPAISPNGRFVASSVQGPTQTLWIYDRERSTMTALPAIGSSQAPLWTSDGKRLVYRATRGGFRTIYWRAADGSGDEERLTTSTSLETPTSISRDGTRLFFSEVAADTGADIWNVSLVDRRQPPQVVLQTRFYENSPHISPDGRWLAYASNESGPSEIYVQAFPALGDKLVISSDGGIEPRWSRDGRELFYRTGDKMMAVPVTIGSSISAGAPRVLFEGRYQISDTSSDGYDVASDGRFLMVEPIAPPQPAPQIAVVLNWFDDVRSRVRAAAK
jgi:serine/threonine-protein kinase